MAFSPYIAPTVISNSSGSWNDTSTSTWDEPIFRSYYIAGSGWNVKYVTAPAKKEPPKKHPVELF